MAMKKTQFIFSGLSIIILLMQLISPLYAQTDRRNIAVLDLDAMGISPAEAQFLSDRLRTELFETGVFQVVEREKMQEILKEQGFQKTGCTSVECAVEIGQLLNVSEMVAGNIGKIEEVYSISLRIIKVETGAIIKTATRDYRGKLSEVLTEVIPIVAAELAGAEKQVAPTLPKKVPDEKEEQVEKFSRFAILFKAGLALLQYTQDINKYIDDFNQANPGFTFDDLSNHSNLGFEGRYYFAQKIALKLGLTSMNIYSPLQHSARDFEDIYESHFYEKLSYERDFNFVNIYVGINYNIWYAPEKYAFYIGIDIGNTVYEARIKEDYIKEGESYSYDNSNSYSAFTIKLATGFEFYITSSFSLAAEVVFQSVAEYNTSEEVSEFEYFPAAYQDVIFPNKISGGGIQFNMLLGLHL
jgi:hypothetical protein